MFLPDQFIRKLSNHHQVYRLALGPLESDPLKLLKQWCDRAKLDDKVFAGLKLLREQNREAVENVQEVSILLDGRGGTPKGKETKTSGYLGDRVEWSRLIGMISSTGRNLHVITEKRDWNPLPNDPAIVTERIESYGPQLPLRSKSYWKEVMARAEGRPLINPVLARFPFWFGLTDSGLAGAYGWDHDSPHIRRMPGRTFPAVIKKSFWTAAGVHQVHAMQMLMYLLGLVEKFPDTIHPAHLSVIDEINVCIQNDSQLIFTLEELIELANGKKTPLLIASSTSGADGKRVHKNLWKKIWRKALVPSDSPWMPIVLHPPKNVDCENYQRSRYVFQSIGEEAGAIGYEVHCDGLNSLEGFLERIISANPKTVVFGHDSLIAGHLAPALGATSVVLGNRQRGDTYFSSPARQNGDPTYLVLPPNGVKYASSIVEDDVVFALSAAFGQVK